MSVLKNRTSIDPAIAGKPLEGRAGIVTGGSSGIGRATVIAMVEAGARVIVADIDETGGRETVALAGGDVSACFVQTDVTDPSSVENMVRKTLDRFGQLDFAHNNAGIEFVGSLLGDVPLKEWQKVLDVNLTGVFNCMRAEIPHMIGSGGSIVNTASGLGLVAIPNHSPYVAAKHGLIGLTRAAAIEYAAKGIRVNCICPGAILTHLLEEVFVAEPNLRAAVERSNPAKRLGLPEEIAAAVIWLCSEASAYVNGHPLVIDGGHLASGAV